MDFPQTLLTLSEQGPDVPGTPYSLRVDVVAPATSGRSRIDWSFRDPTGESDRIAGSTEMPVTATADQGWRAAQLDAAHAYKGHLDLDTRPGEPYEPVRHGVDEAWTLLLSHLRRWHDVHEHDGFLLVDAQHRFVADRASWAAYLAKFADETHPGPEEDPDGWVPCAIPLDDQLPLWASDDLAEALGAWGDCRVVGREIVPDPRS